MAKQNTQSLYWTFFARIDPMLLEDEVVKEVGEAQWVQGAELIGRGGATGLLVVTDKAVLMELDSDGTRVRLARQQISNPRKSWIVMPNFNEVHFGYLHENLQPFELSFYCTKRLARAIIRELQ